MKVLSTSCAVVLVCAAFTPSATAADAELRVRRFAFVVGANDGGSERVTLRYAGTDATNVGRVLQELGGVTSDDVVTLLDPSVAELQRGFDQVGRLIERGSGPGVRTELLVYYSGHSDESGLLLAGERFGYRELRERIRTMPADVSIAILDSCASGAFTRRKGGTRRAPFLIDEGSQVKGYAFLTSSSEDEAAQESDRIGASFFTHYLVSGMRGAADSNRDGRVTLNEVYQFAFHETVTRTETMQAGAQHPAYDIHLVGTGDVVMTDLRSTSAALEVGSKIAGRLYIRDDAGQLVIELQKPAGRPVVLGLGARTYVVTLHSERGYYRASVTLAEGKRSRLALADFLPVGAEVAVARGAGSGVVGSAEPALPVVPVAIQLVPQIYLTGEPRSVHNFSLNLLVGRGYRLRGAELGGIANIRDENVRGAQLAGVANIAMGRLDGAQLSGVFNSAAGPVDGWQLSGVANYAGDELSGAQLGGVTNYARGNVRGAQVSGVYNYAGGDVEGFQVSGVYNYAAGEVRGGQIGVVNIGGYVRGTQIGVLNIATRVQGTQVGVVNIAGKAAGAPVGLVSFASDGRLALEVWASDAAEANVGVKLGVGRMYTLLSASATPSDYLVGWGLGVHTPGDGYWVDVDLVGYGVLGHDLQESDNDLMASFRAAVGVPLAGDLHLFAGASLNGVFAFDGKSGEDVHAVKGTTVERADYVLRIAPGFFAGLSY